MSVEQNKANLKIIVEEGFNKGNTELAHEYFSPNWSYKSSIGAEFKGVEGARQLTATYRNAFPDLMMTIDEVIGEGDRLASIQTLTGTFTGKLGNIEPTGRKINIKIAHFYTFEDGKQKEVVPLMDSLDFFKQLGISPSAGQ
jgi:predicted ester cyclase